MAGKSSTGRGGKSGKSVKAADKRNGKATALSNGSGGKSGKSGDRRSGNGASTSTGPRTRGAKRPSGGGRSSSQSSNATLSGSPSSHTRRTTVFPPVNLQLDSSALPPVNLHPSTASPEQNQMPPPSTSPPPVLPRRRPSPDAFLQQPPPPPPPQPQFNEDLEEEEDDSDAGYNSDSESSDSDGEWECPPEAREPPVPLDYEAILDNFLQLPGRTHLPVLSKDPIEGVETIWFTRDKGKLSRVISKIFRRKFDGPYYSWSVTPLHIQERYLRTFAKKYNWDGAITEDVREGFEKIAKKRMKGIVSQAKTSGKKPKWIVKKLWKHMWKHWKTPDAVEKSETASHSRNSDRGGLGVHKHLSGQKSYLQVQQELEEELGRPVSLGEVFLKTHTRPDGTFVDQKAKQVAEEYKRNLGEIMIQRDGDGPANSENSSETSTHRNLSIDEQNEIFLKCTQTDDKGNPFGLEKLGRNHEQRQKKRELCKLFFLNYLGDASATT